MATSGVPAYPNLRTGSNGPPLSLPLASNFLFAASDWVYSFAIVILAFHLGNGLGAAAGVLLIHAGVRLLVIGARPERLLPIGSRRPRQALEALRVMLIAALIFVTTDDRLWIALVLAAVIGLLGAVIDAARQTTMPVPRAWRHHRSLRARLACRWDQIAMIVGSLASGALIVAWSERPAFVLAAVLALAAALIAQRIPSSDGANSTEISHPNRFQATATTGLSGTVRMMLLALAAGAALGIAIRVMLVEIVLADHGDTELVYGMFIALAGAGAFAGPLSIPRLLGKLPSEFVLGGVVGALACALVAAHLVEPLALAVPIVAACGLLAVTGERAGETVLRRRIPDRDLDGALHLLAIATITGQVVALATVAALYYVSGIPLVLTGLSAMSIVCALVPILIYMRNRRRLAVTSGD